MEKQIKCNAAKKACLKMIGAALRAHQEFCATSCVVNLLLWCAIGGVLFPPACTPQEKLPLHFF